MCVIYIVTHFNDDHNIIDIDHDYIWMLLVFFISIRIPVSFQIKKYITSAIYSPDSEIQFEKMFTNKSVRWHECGSLIFGMEWWSWSWTMFSLFCYAESKNPNGQQYRWWDVAPILLIREHFGRTKIKTGNDARRFIITIE